ncbi:recombinase family protein [Neorhizobium sp. DAR64861/K0K2]|uniref:recombinase family protein n=1 Tax=unclassified Neorhizobium TaxID=2629175 RepID=UPI003D26D0EF
MNVSASSIPYPVHKLEPLKRRSPPRISQFENREKSPPQSDPSRRVAFYARSASVSRAETDKQLALLFDFAKTGRGWMATTCFTDWGSGLKKGAGLSALINAITLPNSEFDVIFVTNWCRISRSIDIFNEVQETASRSAVSLFSLSEIQDPTPTSQFSYDVFEAYEQSRTRRIKPCNK